METYNAMVALYPSAATKELVSKYIDGIDGAYNLDDLHCTLVFLGDEFPDDPIITNSITDALYHYAARLPIYAEVSAQTQFGPEYSVLLVDGKGIAELYTDVSRELNNMAFYNASEHGFCAHMSVVTGECPDLDALQLPLVFDRLVLAVGPNRYEIGQQHDSGF